MIDEDSKGELSLKIGELNNYQEEKNDKNNKTNCKDFNVSYKIFSFYQANRFHCLSFDIRIQLYLL